MTAIEHLAERCGIQHSTVDVFGKDCIITHELKQTVLTAMGFRVETEEQAAQVLADMEATEWERALPPVLVALSGSIEVLVTVAQTMDAVTWALTLEDGTEMSGQAPLCALEVIEARTHKEEKLVRRRISLFGSIPCGYHSLQLMGADTLLIVTPGKCWLPDIEQGQRYWGVAAQLFLLRSERNWGIGDFTDLRELVKLMHDQGADLVGLNPLHAMFLDKPGEASPYSPSDRTLLNVLNIDVEAIPELAQSEPARKLIASEHFQKRLATARSSHMVEYETVAELKVPVLRLLFGAFEEETDASRRQQFADFRQEQGDALDRACLFQAMRQWFSSQTPAQPDPDQWPEQYRRFCSPGTADFARKHASLVRYHLWLQWIADSQLREAAEAVEGMAIGIYRDLAVGAGPGGAEVWSHPSSLASGASIGAPPDVMNRSGQNWGLPPVHPINARNQKYRSFIELLRANMRYAGALRIDHAMALMRLYWIPNGNEAKDGAYVHYPMEDLIGILALESQRCQCLVVGEDLGTVPEGFRERMAEANVLSYRVLFFEKKDNAFSPPESYPHLALSVAGNHDLSTILGWWEGSDIDLKERLGLFKDGAEQTRSERERDRQSLLALLREQDLISRQQYPGTEEVTHAVHAFLGRTNSLVAVMQLDDLTSEREQINLPGTTNERPNWRRRLCRSLEELRYNSVFQAMARELAEQRTLVTEPQS